MEQIKAFLWNLLFYGIAVFVIIYALKGVALFLGQ